MKTDYINLDGLIVKALVIEREDKGVPCENCGKDKFNHPDIVREIDDDWCLNCNDVAMNMSEEQYNAWCLNLASTGKIVCIVREG